MESEVPLLEKSIDIERENAEVPWLAMVNSLEDEMNKLGPPPRNPCIYRVPNRLRVIKPEAYTPQVVSIGPIHHKTQGLEAMEEYKQRYMKLFLERIDMSLENYAKFVKDKEECLRKCYADKIDLTSDEFVRIMMVDSAFVYEVLVMIGTKNNRSTSILNRSCLLLDVMVDLMLLENQIPLFILKDLFNLHKEAQSAPRPKSPIRSDEQPEDLDAILLSEEVDRAEKKHTEQQRPSSNLEDVSKVEEQAKSDISLGLDDMLLSVQMAMMESATSRSPSPEAEATPLKDLVCKFIDCLPENMTRGSDTRRVCFSEGVHLLDCLRRCHLSTNPKPTPSEDKTMFLSSLISGCLRLFSKPESDRPRKANEISQLLFSVPTITELHQSGVTFTENTNSAHLLNIEFDDKRGILKIPHFFMVDPTEPLFRNLLAFEQWHCENDQQFTDYFVLLDQLINDPSDVDLLVRRGVLKNGLGDHRRAANVINQITLGLAISQERHFDDLRAKLTKYYKEPWHKWRATLRQDYFNSPWAVISVIAAAILLALTIVQTVYAIISK